MTATPAPVPDGPATTVSEWVKEYVMIRDMIKAKKDAFEKSLEKASARHNELTDLLQGFLEAAGADNIRTPYGTAHGVTKHSASLADPETFMNFVKAGNHFDMVDARANVTACREWTTEHGVPPPGVNLSSFKTIGVRRPDKKIA